ncbi:hypothetical protein FIV42_07855 [Persicimonas caeni]|uniref:PKD domain-containing protein n=1 Tax=Persicimonas caeni TaxID=2292766 RepID=A0A4Y6PQP2_PERCE|nr:hypothetical protein [Persicimonas caeni]QDG50648.1 hypothetical protein FIV42_07855 [Persicimonas caeni]QED31869.1 hypothetical protein FRD00_07850 [Persicimonas caeni]
MTSCRLIFPLFASLTLLALSGCVDLGEVTCESDNDCRFGRVCSTAGQCTWTAPPTQTPIEEDAGPVDAGPHDAGPGPDTTPIEPPDAVSDVSTPPDTTPTPDTTPGPDTTPQPDVGNEPDTSLPDTSVPDAATPNCPTAVARARGEHESDWQITGLAVAPLETVSLDATSSSGDITRYEWTLVSRPSGSTTRLVPSNTVEQPTLFLDLAGWYELELRVIYDDGDVVCDARDEIRIRAIPNEDVHIELTWDTPADADQTDGSGTDFDLHYLHPNGQWNNYPWDIFWENPRGDWGVQGDSWDDPSLDLDDTNGAGPENITHSGLENLTYNIGAYYYASGTLGASYATLRVYIDGLLAFEFADKYLDHDELFWHVAQLTWPSGQIMAVDQVYDGFPTAP